jgi:DNA-binding transcriptional LysR family regulator
VPGLDPSCVSKTLFVDEHVCVVRADHPLRKQKPTKEDLAGLRYVYASTNATGHRMVEQWLEELNLKRDVVLRLPHFVVAPEIVRNTDLAVIFPKSIAQRFNQNKAFRILPLPFSLPPIEIQVHSHAQFSADPGIAWLRDAIYEMFHQPGF